MAGQNLSCHLFFMVS